MGLCGVGESHAPDAFAAVLNPATDTHLSVTRIHNDGIMQGAALPSTPPVWVTTHTFVRPPGNSCGFYPRHPCGWRLKDSDKLETSLKVSIHATRVGGDGLSCHPKFARKLFLSTPPVWVATLRWTAALKHGRQFLSTPPVWVATAHCTSLMS